MTGEIWWNFLVFNSKILHKLQFMNILLESARPHSRTIKELTKHQAIQNGEEYGFGK